MREDGHIGEADRLSDLLLQRLKAAKGESEIAEVLDGMSNAAYPPFVDAIRPYLAHDTVEVRLSAVRSLRLIDALEVDHLIASALSKDPVFKVRLMAADTSREREHPKDVLIQAVSKAAQSDSDTRVRVMAVRTLGAWMPTHPKLRKVVESVAAHDADPSVQSLAKAVLSARDG